MDNTALPTRAEDMFCFGVYTASHMINRAYSPMLAKLGLTYPQYITLTLLWDCDGQNVNALAKQLRMATSTLTPLVKRLEVMGLVSRTRGRKDARTVAVHLTAQGRQLQNAAPGITACMVEATSLSQHELQDLQALLAKLCDGLSAS